MTSTYSKTARYYDKMYAAKDYQAEVQRIISLVGLESESKRQSLLDVACGTGLHIEYLKRRFQVEGLDICPELLQIAQERNPDMKFHQGDMLNFNLEKRFDVITCLFSAIGYVKTLDNLRAAIRTMVAHLNPGGKLVIEPWFTPDAWLPDTVHGIYIDEPDLKIARINTSYVEGRLSYFDMHYLIGTPEGTEHIVENHELGLFTIEETTTIMEEEGLTVEYDTEGLMGRGLYVARRESLCSSG